jgi:hypothetical protein
LNIWKTFSENFYEGKFGISGGLEETWGGGREIFGGLCVVVCVFWSFRVVFVLYCFLSPTFKYMIVWGLCNPL